MSLPIVAIIGRPNVGKSRLFNRLIGGSKALVDDQPGVTRDRHYAKAEWGRDAFIIVDTGGLIPGSEDPLNQKVWQQALNAIKEADLILCIFDGREGLSPSDEALVKTLRKQNKPTLYVLNKIDTASTENKILDFNRLGVDLLPVSAEHSYKISHLLDAIVAKLPQTETVQTKEQNTDFRISIIGRPNVGKSTLLNRLAGDERVVVHEEAGTTRDAIDVLVEWNSKKYVFVDTAGIKRKSATKTRLEKFSVIQSLKTVEHSDLVLLLLDALEGLTHHDLHLAHHIWSLGKAIVILVNKWDLIEGSASEYTEELQFQLRSLPPIPILILSAKTGKNCEKTFDWIAKISEDIKKRTPTHKLNQWVRSWVTSNPPPSYKDREVKLYYATQIETAPPHFVFFTNQPKGITSTYERYLTRRLLEVLKICGIPVRLSFRLRSSS